MSNHLFKGTDYIIQQSQVLLEYFNGWEKLLEIGGEFLHDTFLTNILPWYEKNSQSKILKQLFADYPDTTLIYCISAKDLVRDKQFGQKYLSFEKYILKELALISSSLQKKAHVVITLMDDDFIPPHVRELEVLLTDQGYSTEQYPLWRKYNISNNHTIVTSYDSKTGKSMLCKSTETSYVTRAPLPVSYDEYHPLNTLAQAYHYHKQDNTNLSILEDYITDLWGEYYRSSCTTLIEERITLYEKLLFSGYIEEEEIESLKNLLIYLRE